MKRGVCWVRRWTLNGRYPQIDGHRWFFALGMISDDMEQRSIVAEALVRTDGDIAVFERGLACGQR
jgi:ADP-ribosylglycohydrolase